jgi:uncharacterized membrane protein YfcA
MELLAVAFVAIGAFAQAITGIGFALVCGPLMVLCLGPEQGVIVTSVLGLVLSALVLWREWRHVDLRHALSLFVPACAVIPAAAIVARFLSAGTLSVVIGVMVIAAVAVLAKGFRWSRLKGLSGAAMSGGVCGFMGYLAGVGGPAVAMYAVNSEWSVKTLRPTINTYFIGVSVVYLFVRGTPTVGAAFGTGLAAAMFAGFAGGAIVAKRIDVDTVRRLILVLAGSGGVAAIVKGLDLV